MERRLVMKKSMEPLLQIEIEDRSLPFTAQKSEDHTDASPVSSPRYSSCEESDYERYCSANSVMGTPSICSSQVGFHDCVESDFGSFKSFGAGGESDGLDLEGFRLDGKVHGFGDDKWVRFSGGLGKWDGGGDVFDGVEDEDGELKVGVEAGDEMVGGKDRLGFNGMVGDEDQLGFNGEYDDGAGDHGLRELGDGVGAWQRGVGEMCGTKRINGDQDLVNISVVRNQLHGNHEQAEKRQGFVVSDVSVKQDFTHPMLPGIGSISTEANAHKGSNSSLEGFSIKDYFGNKLVEGNESNPVFQALHRNKGDIKNDIVLIEDRDKGKNSEMNGFYDEIVDEMEEILLDSSGSPVGQPSQKNATFHSLKPSILRDGGPTASTSCQSDGYTLIHPPLKIDNVEVVGARRKRGDTSFPEKLVGSKEHTVYAIRVWSSKDQWEVERRYRDFCILYHDLKSIFSQQGLILPSPWSSVEQESRKIFGSASTDAISVRSVLIQECLHSILQFRHSSGLPSSLIWFLSAPKDLPCATNAFVHRHLVALDAKISTLGKRISLIVELHPYKSMRQMLEVQQYTCAACCRSFYDGNTRIQEFALLFGWGKLRLCEYTGQLFCSSCHTNDKAVLPARVVHNWDFAEYPVSQLAKAYLDSIIDQPMLCVSAVNPFLFSKVPALLHVVGIRKKIAAMLVYVQCPFRSTVYRGLRSRRYLLENNGFFALRDLIDLSKGAFAALPVILDTVLRKIEKHITQLCLICCDVGVPCGAQQSCYDPSSLIFPFQEEETIHRCSSCTSVFHTRCSERLLACPCGGHLKSNNAHKYMTERSLGAVGHAVPAPPLLPKRSDLAVGEGFLSHLFSSEEIRFNNIQGISVASFLRGNTIK